MPVKIPNTKTVPKAEKLVTREGTLELIGFLHNQLSVFGKIRSFLYKEKYSYDTIVKYAKDWINARDADYFSSDNLRSEIDRTFMKNLYAKLKKYVDGDESGDSSNNEEAEKVSKGTNRSRADIIKDQVLGPLGQALNRMQEAETTRGAARIQPQIVRNQGQRRETEEQQRREEEERQRRDTIKEITENIAEIRREIRKVSSLIFKFEFTKFGDMASNLNDVTLRLQGVDNAINQAVLKRGQVMDLQNLLRREADGYNNAKQTFVLRFKLRLEDWCRETRNIIDGVNGILNNIERNNTVTPQDRQRLTDEQRHVYSRIDRDIPAIESCLQQYRNVMDTLDLRESLEGFQQSLNSFKTERENIGERIASENVQNILNQKGGRSDRNRTTWFTKQANTHQVVQIGQTDGWVVGRNLLGRDEFSGLDGNDLQSAMEGSEILRKGGNNARFQLISTEGSKGLNANWAAYCKNCKDNSCMVKVGSIFSKQEVPAMDRGTMIAYIVGSYERGEWMTQVRRG